MLGQPCPIPVVKAQEILAEQDAAGVMVLVDNTAAVQNLEKMAKGTGCGFSYVEEGHAYRVRIVKNPEAGRIFTTESPPEPQPDSPPETLPAIGDGAKKGPVVLITSDTMGRGSDELGRMLIKGFIFSLTQLNPLPEAVMFLNGGARLTTAGANTVPDLKALEEKGTGIYTCGTCANYYTLTESLAVGSIVDMMHIVNRLAKASVVLTI
jgi:selenium metabolism protein YedF